MWYIYTALVMFIAIFIFILIEYWEDGNLEKLLGLIVVAIVSSMFWPLTLPVSIVMILKEIYKK